MAERVHLIRIGYGYAIAGSLPPAAIGDAYSRTLTALGGVGTKRLEILSENVTDAITFTDNGDNTATFAMADPQTAGTYSITVRATDADRQRWTRTFSFDVIALPLAITGSLANCTVGSAYSDTLTVSGGIAPYSLGTVTGLPAGLSANLAGDTITISGTPTGAGLGPGTAFTASVSVTVMDSAAGDVTYTQSVGITVTAVTAVFDPATLPDASVGAAYSADTNASGGVGGPYTFTKQAGPAWVSVNSSTGAITGTPAGGDVGTGITLTVRATDSEGNYDDVSDTMDVNNPSFYDTVVALGPWAYWPGDTTSGTALVDHSGNGRDGTLVNSPTLNVSSPVQPPTTWITYDGINDYGYIAANAADTVAAFSGDSEWTIILIYAQTANATREMVHIGNNGVGFGQGINFRALTGGQVEVQYFNSGSGYSINTSAGAHVLNSGTPQFFVARRQVGGTVDLFVDGANVYTASGRPTLSFSGATGEIYAPGGLVQGGFGHCALFDYALSDTEISDLFALTGL